MSSRGDAATTVPNLILSDIHANLEALHAVLAEADGKYDRILCLGDLVGYGADPNAIIEWARAHAPVIVRGNHDKVCSGNDSLEHYNAGARFSAEWTRGVLTAENLDFLRNLPRGPLRYEDYDLVHGSPEDEDEYLISPFDVAPVRRFLEAQATMFGHTHIQGGFLVARGGIRAIRPKGTLELEPQHLYLLNPGAVGQPRDGDPRAAYALWWPEERRIEYCRTSYDVAAAAAKIRAARLPDSLAERLFHGL
jgi:diadenosine tetraphosphatase ApaH/serine/threonine PP2A family protein phosphatase